MADYSNLKVAELKELVKERGIASTGLKLKQHFIDALASNDAEEADSTPNDAVGENVGVELDAAQGVDVEFSETVVDQDDSSNKGNDDAENVGDPESRKRKRESPTASSSPDTPSKRLKPTQEAAAPQSGDDPEDTTGQSAPAPEIQKEDTSNVHADLDAAQGDEHQELDVQKEDDTRTSSSQEHATATLTPAAAKDANVRAAKHPATRSLYIRGIVRPLQPGMLREHLVSIAQEPDTPLDPSTVGKFHLDKLRTHALVLFSSVSAAARARNALHDQIWPQESMRKPLWADFIPDEKVQDWIDTETSDSDMTRWEVIYRSEPDGVTVSLQKAAPTRPSGDVQPGGPLTQRQSSFSGVGEPPGLVPVGPRRRSPQMQPAEEDKPQSRSFDSLDSRFKFTETKPKLYYQPVPHERVQRRLDEIDHHTRHDWKDSEADPSAYAEGELRRYTFEDDKIVDGGVDFGIFGRRPRAGPGIGPATSRGGGGRGRRGGLDHYRPGGHRR